MLAKTSFALGASAVGLGVVAAFTGSPVFVGAAAVAAMAAWYVQERMSGHKDKELNRFKSAAQASLDEAKKLAVSADKSVSHLEGRVAWRRFTERERDAFMDALGTAPPGQVILFTRDSRDEEAQEFAKEIADVLAASGWRYRTMNGSDDLVPRHPVGLSIRVVDPSNPPEHARTLKAALDSALGLDVPMMKAPPGLGSGEDAVVLVVHPKRL